MVMAHVQPMCLLTYRRWQPSTLFRRQESFCKAAYEMVVIGLAVGADNHLRILRVEVQAFGDVHHSPTTALA